MIILTLADMVDERNALMERLYPRLKDFCRDKYGLEFQVITISSKVTQIYCRAMTNWFLLSRRTLPRQKFGNTLHNIDA